MNSFLFSMITYILTFTIGSAASTILHKYDLAHQQPKSVLLPKVLKEISGLTMTEDGRLFAHNDEQGAIYQIDYRTGSVLKQFYVTKKGWFSTAQAMEDFEDIAFAKGRFFLVTSGGTLYEFAEGENGQEVLGTLHKTGLNDHYDIEGLCYDPETESLLIACKEYPGNKNFKPVFSFSLKTMVLTKAPRFLLPVRELENASEELEFKPSGIERHPKTGTFFVLAAQGNLLVELSPDGKILSTATLTRKFHPQPEGITFTPDNILLISDEGEKHGTLSSYKLTQ